MTYDQMLSEQSKARRKRHEDEHRLQTACVRWFKFQYPKMHHNLFAVPNGSKRDAVTGAKLKAEGVLAGVSDLILLKSNRFYGALLIEMKTPTGYQSKSQAEWQHKIMADGYKYVVIRSIEEFKNEITSYLAEI